MTILGLTSPLAGIHDNSAVLLIDGTIVFAATEERFTRIKHDLSFPKHAIDAAFAYAKITWRDLDAIAAVVPDYNIFSMIKNEPGSFAGIALSLLKRAPWTTLSTLPPLMVNLGLPTLFGRRLLPKITHWYFDHHLTHAASAYWIQPHEDALVAAIDGYGPTKKGEWLAGVVYDGTGGRLIERDRVGIAASFGLFYQAITVALGFTPNDGEGKTMGWAAYGKRTGAYDTLKTLAPHWDGRRWRGMPHWRELMISGRKQARPLFLATPSGEMIKALITRYGPENVAWAAQEILEDELVRYIKTLLSRPRHLACAGGVFLNVRLNKKLRELSRVKSIFVQPHAGDGGCAAGAALAAYAHIIQSHMRARSFVPLQTTSAALGVEYTDGKILETLQAYEDKITWKKPRDIAVYVGRELTKGKVIGWFQGRAEWGPRALGHRSVLADPRDLNIKNRINNILKQREWFMPFAPSVLEEDAPQFFNECDSSPFMTMVYDVPKLRAQKIPAAVHIDNTARPNTVSKKDNPLYYRLIKAVQKQTGLPVILNTSFNKHGLPIVNAPKDAIEHLIWGCVDELAIGSFLAKRRGAS